jgi:hypothetical protein
VAIVVYVVGGSAGQYLEMETIGGAGVPVWVGVDVTVEVVVSVIVGVTVRVGVGTAQPAPAHWKELKVPFAKLKICRPIMPDV